MTWWLNWVFKDLHTDEWFCQSLRRSLTN